VIKRDSYNNSPKSKILVQKNLQIKNKQERKKRNQKRRRRRIMVIFSLGNLLKKNDGIESEKIYLFLKNDLYIYD